MLSDEMRATLVASKQLAANLRRCEEWRSFQTFMQQRAKQFGGSVPGDLLPMMLELWNHRRLAVWKRRANARRRAEATL